MTQNRIPQYDFIKGFAIIAVILLHTLDAHLLSSGAFLHIWQAVPLFVLVSFILLFRKLDKTSVKEYYSKESILKISKKILLPFLLIEGLIILIFFISGEFDELPLSYKFLGAGPGAYYPFIYIQIWLITPLFYFLFKKHENLMGGGIIILTISILTLLTFLFIQNDFIYKRWFIRYAFLGVLAWLWHDKHTDLKWLIPLSIISIIYSISVVYYSINFEPFLDSRWSNQQAPAFFYTLLLFIILWKFCNYLSKKYPNVMAIISWCGNNSYEIFLLQMFWLTFIGNWSNYLTETFTEVGYVLIIFVISILPVWIYRNLYRLNFKTKDIITK